MDWSYKVVANQHKDKDHWIEEHSQYIGASGMSCIMGLSPFKSQLQYYLEYTGVVAPEDISDNEWVKWGQRLESVIAEAACEALGVQAMEICGDLRVSTKLPWACSTPDVTCADGYDLQVKNVNAYRSDEFSAGGMPEWLRIQLHHEMLVSGHDRIHWGVLIGGNHLVWGTLLRDQDTIEQLIRAGGDFIARTKNDDPPLPDGSDSATDALKALYPSDDGSVVELAHNFVELSQERLEWKKAEAAAKTRIKEIDNLIKAAIGPARVGVLPGGLGEFIYTTVKKKGYTKTYEPSSYRMLKWKGPKL